MKKVLILDSGAFLSGYLPGKEGAYTVAEVMGELRDEGARLRAEVSLREGKLRIVEPPESEVLRKALEETGEGSLSTADIRILSLALHLREGGGAPVIVTDDYAVQNVAGSLGIEYMPAAERGIRRQIRWRMVCTGCGRAYPSSHRERCGFCGSKVRRRAVK